MNKILAGLLLITLGIIIFNFYPYQDIKRETRVDREIIKACEADRMRLEFLYNHK